MSIEIHIGVVTNNFEGIPEMRGAVSVACESLLDSGEGKVEKTELPEPVFPSFAFAGNGFGVFYVPPVGSFVELEVESGAQSVDYANIKYRAMLYSYNTELPSEFQQNYGKRYGIKTPGGFLIFIDESETEPQLVIQTAGGAYLIFNDKDKVVTLEGVTIMLGESANFNVPQAESLQNAIDTMMIALKNHYHIGNKGKPTSGSIPSIQDISPASTWSSGDVKTR